jgi:NAD(P)-dependent dehydrogenase (short-subunit alcohol dehydrogenase family)
MKTVVITGASTGIGRAAAEHLAARGWRVFAGVRKDADAETLGAVGNENLIPVRLDVTNESDVRAAVEMVSAALNGAKLAGLVNNAGIAKMGPLAIQPLSDFEAHFSVNVFGMLRATQAFVPLLGADEARSGTPGRIVNITSVGGRVASPFLGAYTATKHANESMTDSLRRELVVYGIDAIAVGPGAVKTPIWDKAEADNQGGAYQGSDWAASLAKYEKVMLESGQEGLETLEVAKVIERALSDASPKARYAPVPNKLVNFTIASRLPKRWLDKVFWSRFDLSRKST